MKRARQFVECCDLCEIQFESSSSFLRHCGSKNHKLKLMIAQSAVHEEDNDDDHEVDMLWDETRPTEAHKLLVPDRNSPVNIPPMARINNTESDGETLPSGRDDRCESDLGTEKSAFYPFPDEKFFLLYCCAHGIMRSKVRNTCFSADCSSYPGAHKRLEQGW